MNRSVKPCFPKISCFKEVGWKFDQWIDVGDRELVL